MRQTSFQSHSPLCCLAKCHGTHLKTLLLWLLQCSNDINLSKMFANSCRSRCNVFSNNLELFFLSDRGYKIFVRPLFKVILLCVVWLNVMAPFKNSSLCAFFNARIMQILLKNLVNRSHVRCTIFSNNLELFSLTDLHSHSLE